MKWRGILLDKNVRKAREVDWTRTKEAHFVVRVGQLLARVGLSYSHVPELHARIGLSYSYVLLRVTRVCWSELIARVGLNCSRNGRNYSRVLV